MICTKLGVFSPFKRKSFFEDFFSEPVPDKILIYHPLTHMFHISAQQDLRAVSGKVEWPVML